MSIKYADDKIKEVRDIYMGGLSIRATALRTNVSDGRVFKWCRDILRNKIDSHKGKMPKNIEILKNYCKGRKLTEEQKKVLSDAHKRIGDRPPSRRGTVPWNYEGKTILTEQIRKCFEYRQWRSDVYTRDNFTCVRCGSKGGVLNADHIKTFSQIIREYRIKDFKQALSCEELWNINNGRTLCYKCHDDRGLWDEKYFLKHNFRKNKRIEHPIDGIGLILVNPAMSNGCGVVSKSTTGK